MLRQPLSHIAAADSQYAISVKGVFCLLWAVQSIFKSGVGYEHAHSKNLHLQEDLYFTFHSSLQKQCTSKEERCAFPRCCVLKVFKKVLRQVMHSHGHANQCSHPVAMTQCP